MSNYNVLVPVFNAENVLEDTLKEIERLEYLDVCIFIDDASKDGTKKTLEQWESGLAKVFYIKENGRKIGSIWKVLQQMKQESTLPKYMVLSDGDTFFYNHSTKDALNKAIQFMESKSWKAMALIDVPFKNHNLLQRLQYWEYMSDRAIHNILCKKGEMRCICGAGGIYDSEVLLKVLNQHSLRHSGDDMETTVLVQKLGHKVGYFNADIEARTIVPNTWTKLFRQRIRWTMGAVDTYVKERGFYIKQITKHDRWSAQILYETVKLFTYVGWYYALLYNPISILVVGWIGTYGLSSAFFLINPESKGQRRKGMLWMIPTSVMIYVTDIVRLPVAFIKCTKEHLLGWEVRAKYRFAKCYTCRKFTPYRTWRQDEETKEWTKLDIHEILCKNKRCRAVIPYSDRNMHMNEASK